MASRQQASSTLVAPYRLAGAQALCSARFLNWTVQSRSSPSPDARLPRQHQQTPPAHARSRDRTHVRDGLRREHGRRRPACRLLQADRLRALRQQGRPVPQRGERIAGPDRRQSRHRLRRPRSRVAPFCPRPSGTPGRAAYYHCRAHAHYRHRPFSRRSQGAVQGRRAEYPAAPGRMPGRRDATRRATPGRCTGPGRNAAGHAGRFRHRRRRLGLGGRDTPQQREEWADRAVDSFLRAHREPGTTFPPSTRSRMSS